MNKMNLKALVIYAHIQRWRNNVTGDLKVIENKVRDEKTKLKSRDSGISTWNKESGNVECI